MGCRSISQPLQISKESRIIGGKIGRKLLRDSTGVSEVIGYVLTIAVTSTILVTALYVSSQIIDHKVTEAASYQAKALANQIADAIVDAAWVKRSLPNANYERNIRLPDTIAGLSYYVELTDDAIYVNTSDGRVSEKVDTYKLGDLGMGLHGRVYGGIGSVRIVCNKTKYLYRFDFGTSNATVNSYPIPSSPLDLGYYWVSNVTKIGCIPWDDLSRPYRLLIKVLNTGNSTKNLSNYWVKIRLNTLNFDYGLANRSGLDIEVFCNCSGVSKRLPCWIERWNPNGTSTVWFMIDNISMNETKYFYLYYGNKHPNVDWQFLYLPTNISRLYMSYPDDNLLFYDDFNYSNDDELSDKWILHEFTNIDVVDEKYLTLGYNDTIITKEEFVLPPGPPKDKPAVGEATSNATRYVIEAKIKLSDDVTDNKIADIDILPVTTTDLTPPKKLDKPITIYYMFCLPLIKSRDTPNASSIWNVMEAYAEKSSMRGKQFWCLTKTDCLATSIGGCAKDRWSIIRATVERMYVYDWENKSKETYEEYNATNLIIESIDESSQQIFNSVSGGSAFNGTIAVPDIINPISGEVISYKWISVDINNNSFVGIGCGRLHEMNNSLFSNPSHSQKVYVDWISIRREVVPEPTVIIEGKESINYGWNDVDGIYATETEYPCDYLLCDFNGASSSRTFKILDLPEGTYSITITMGDGEKEHDHMYVNLSIEYYGGETKNEGSVISDICTGVGEFKTKWFIVTLRNRGNISLTFGDHDSNAPGDTGWIVNGIDVEEGIKGIRVETK